MASPSSPHPDARAGRLPTWVGVVLAVVFALFVCGCVIGLYVALHDQTAGDNEQFVWRRTLDEPPMFVVAVPSLFALMTLLLIVWLRREGRMQALLVALVVITVLSVVYVPLALALRIMFSWMVVLVPMLAIALFYAGMMYIRDARSIHPLWAMFLGVLRCMVYSILSIVFLLPGCQTFEQSVNYPKVMVLLDVSDSLTKVIDDTPSPGQDPKTLPTRQDKVIDFLTRTVDAKKQPQLPFVVRLLEKSDVVMYRFGKQVDEKEVQRIKQGESIDPNVLSSWLKPDKAQIKVDHLPADKQAAARLDLEDLIHQLRSGTNIPGSANAAAKLENNTYLQAIILISDGNNNAGSDEALIEFLTRVNNTRRNIPVFTVGVGEFRQPAGIRIEDLLAPEVARPDDKFLIRVPVIGTGLADEPFSVTLEATRVILDEAGKEVARDQTYQLGPKVAKFKGGGDHPTGTVEFEVNVQDLKKIKASDPEASGLEGQWEFVAKVPRHPREAFAAAEHVSDRAKVLVQKKELRILLFAGGPTSEYKLLRSYLHREEQNKRVELSVLLQSAITDGRLADHIDLDVDKDHVLVHFPDKRGEPKPGEKQYCLSEYDTIIAIDPDWSQLTKEQLKLLKDWVDKDAGGVIFIAGPVNTHQLARPGGMDISSLLAIYPVLPKDSRLHNLNLGEGGISHVPSQPHVLHFTPAASKYDFLKLDEKGESATAGWDRFFWADELPEPGKPPRRGFYNYYPIAKLKPDSAVIATFGGPPNTYFEDTDGKRKEQPFIVAMRYGGGKTVFIGAGEFWRLRVREGYHERFWIKMARYVAASSTMQKQFGQMYLASVGSVGTVSFDAKLRDTRQEPLPSDSHPVVIVRKLTEGKDEKAEKTDMKPRPTDDPKDWEGYFHADVKIREPGKYEFKIPIPGTAASIRREITIRQPNPEMDNVRNDFEYLYKVASIAPPVLASLKPDVRKEVQSKLKAVGAGGDQPRLFFTLASADAITKCLRQIEPQREKIKGPLYDLWDKGAFDHPFTYNLTLFHIVWISLLVVGVIGGAILASVRQFLLAAIVAGAAVLLSMLVLASGLVIEPSAWPSWPIDLPPRMGAYHLAWGVPLGLGVLGFGILMFLRQTLYAGLFLAGTWFVALVIAIVGLFFDWPDLPINFSFVLVAVVALLSIEWLTRKLLKLA